MDRFESNLRKALREPEASASLAERVLDRVAAAPKKHQFLLAAYPMRTAAAAALAIALGLGGLHYQRQRAAQLESERAKEQVIRAFQLAAEQLRPFQERLSMRDVTTHKSEEKN